MMCIRNRTNRDNTLLSITPGVFQIAMQEINV